MLDKHLQTISDCLCSISSSLPEPQDTRAGISLLGLKNDLFLSYLQNLVFVILLRLRGEEIQNHPVIWQLIENRVWLERGIRPLETKLGYSIEKLLEARVTDTVDALQYKPNPSALVSPAVDESTGQVYRPPKISSTAPPSTSISRPRKNRVMNEFIDMELSQHPVEEPSIGSKRSYMSARELEEHDTRQLYEEEHFTRLPKGKKQSLEEIEESYYDTSKPLVERSKRKNGGRKMGRAYNKGK